MNRISTPNNTTKQDGDTVEVTPAKPLRPEWIRLPQGGLCPWTGLTLPSEKNGFKPLVRSVCLEPAGKTKGVRLVHLQSLLDYLHRRSEGADFLP